MYIDIYSSNYRILVSVCMYVFGCVRSNKFEHIVVSEKSWNKLDIWHYQIKIQGLGGPFTTIQICSSRIHKHNGLYILVLYLSFKTCYEVY